MQNFNVVAKNAVNGVKINKTITALNEEEAFKKFKDEYSKVSLKDITITKQDPIVKTASSSDHKWIDDSEVNAMSEEDNSDEAVKRNYRTNKIILYLISLMVLIVLVIDSPNKMEAYKSIKKPVVTEADKDTIVGSCVTKHNWGGPREVRTDVTREKAKLAYWEKEQGNYRAIIFCSIGAFFLALLIAFWDMLEKFVFGMPPNEKKDNSSNELLFFVMQGVSLFLWFIASGWVS